MAPRDALHPAHTGCQISPLYSSGQSNPTDLVAAERLDIFSIRLQIQTRGGLKRFEGQIPNVVYPFQGLGKVQKFYTYFCMPRLGNRAIQQFILNPFLTTFSLFLLDQTPVSERSRLRIFL
jgi:hypothetical protein